MLHLKKHVYMIVFLVVSIACEEVIDIDLNSANPVLVAEGAIKKGENAWLKLSYTSDYFTTEETEYVTGAEVILSNDTGKEDTLSYVGNGYYKGSQILGVEKDVYKILVRLKDEIYSAKSSLNKESEITKVKVEENSMQRPGHESSYSATISFKDEIGIHNFYLLKFFINDTLQTETYSLVDDSFYGVNGSIDYTPMVLNMSENDVVDVHLYSIDEDTYTYFSQMNDQGGNMMSSSTPYNPQSNFGPKVMGYFAGWSVTKYQFVVE